MFSIRHGTAFQQGPEPMAIGNVGHRLHYHEILMRNRSSVREKFDRSKMPLQVMLVLFAIKKAVGIGSNKMRDSRKIIWSMAMLLSLNKSRKTEGSIERKRRHSGGTREKECNYEFVYNHRVEYNKSISR